MKFYQLWCYHDREQRWKMEGFFRTKEEAKAHHDNIWNPFMEDWLVIELTGEWS